VLAKQVLSQLSYTPPVSFILLTSIPVAGTFRLTTNTGGFVSALSKAAATAQAASKQISREFSDLGRIASQTFGAFGNFNPVIRSVQTRS